VEEMQLLLSQLRRGGGATGRGGIWGGRRRRSARQKKQAGSVWVVGARYLHTLCLGAVSSACSPGVGRGWGNGSTQYSVWCMCSSLPWR
jgi:hypothetical protein